MCMEDEQLGKSKKLGQTAIIPGGISNTPALKGNAKRVGLIVSILDTNSSGSGGILIGTTGSATVGLIGWIDLHRSPVMMTLKDWGTLIQQEIWGLAVTGAADLYLVEVVTEVEVTPYRGKI